MENKKIADIIIKQIHLFFISGLYGICSDYGMNFSERFEKILYIKTKWCIWKI